MLWPIFLWSVCVLAFPDEDRCQEGTRIASCAKAPEAEVTIDRVIVGGRFVYSAEGKESTPKNLEELRTWIGHERTEELLNALNMNVLMEFGQKIMNSLVPFNFPYRAVLTDKSELIVYGLLTDVDPKVRASAPSPMMLPPPLPIPQQKRRSRVMRLLRGHRASVSGLAVKWRLPSTSCAEDAGAEWSEESAWTACTTLACVGDSFKLPAAMKCGGAAGTVLTPNVSDRLYIPADFLMEKVVGLPDLCTRSPLSCDIVPGHKARVTALFTPAELGPFAHMARKDGLAVVWSLDQPLEWKMGGGSSWTYRAFWTGCDDLKCLTHKLEGTNEGNAAKVMRLSRRASNLLWQRASNDATLAEGVQPNRMLAAKHVRRVA